MIALIRDHRLLALVLLVALAVYIFFPLQLQSGEPYNYASAIEGYYRNSIGFALAQGNSLPDFGRYHPNHPLGHVIAAFAFDWFGIPALAWIQIVNAFSSFWAACYLYAMMISLGFARSVSAVAVAAFLSTYCGLFTVLSGEWHMPALALSLAGFYLTFLYIDEGKPRKLYQASLLFAIAACYHLAACFFLVPIGVTLLIIRPFRERWRELVKAGLLILAILVVTYVVIPFILFRFPSFDEFLRTFLVYKYLNHVRYSGFEWLLMAGRTILHTVIYTPARLIATDFLVLTHFAVLVFCFWRFSRIPMARAKKAIILVTPVWWVAVHWVFGARPDALLGWLFVLPLASIIVVKALADLHPKIIAALPILPFIILGWNISLAILPNSLSKPENIFYFNLPVQTPVTTPIAFVTSHPLLMESEIWYAGSKLGYRNQAHFLPCCGEHNYYGRLKNWAKANPGFVLIADGRHAVIENFLRSEGLSYKKWMDRRADWPSSLIPTTLYVQHSAPPTYGKVLTIWVPEYLLHRQ